MPEPAETLQAAIEIAPGPQAVEYCAEDMTACSVIVALAECLQCQRRILPCQRHAHGKACRRKGQGYCCANQLDAGPHDLADHVRTARVAIAHVQQSAFKLLIVQAVFQIQNRLVRQIGPNTTTFLDCLEAKRHPAPQLEMHAVFVVITHTCVFKRCGKGREVAVRQAIRCIGGVQQRVGVPIAVGVGQHIVAFDRLGGA
ncbi:hypothetical protein D3C80_861120 [compost metagenome]